MTHTPLVWYPFEGGEEFPAECHIFVQDQFRTVGVYSSAAMLLYGAEKTLKFAELGLMFMIIPDYDWEGE